MALFVYRRRGGPTSPRPAPRDLATENADLARENAALRARLADLEALLATATTPTSPAAAQPQA
jgi:regulator of replication initiation timing